MVLSPKPKRKGAEERDVSPSFSSRVFAFLRAFALGIPAPGTQPTAWKQAGRPRHPAGTPRCASLNLGAGPDLGQPAAFMYEFPLTGAQKSHLRGLGQRLDASLNLGRGGLTPEFLAELQRRLRAQELVKLRFHGADREERAALCERVADEGRCVCVGAVGHTALFYRQHPDPKARTIELPAAAADQN